MATAPQEMEDLSKIPGGLLINFGTIAGELHNLRNLI
jgi:hydroxyethylthiazole kinase-like sugar kinase family protein